MDVKERTGVNNGHSVEWGESTWQHGVDKSIRNRYNNIKGGFNQAASGEIPWADFKIMISESIKRGQLNNSELADILTDISNKLKTI